MTFVDLQNAVLAIAAEVLDAVTLITHSYSDFEVLFTIPRKVPDPCPLASLEDYETLVESALAMKDPSVSLFVCLLKPPREQKRAYGKENYKDGNSSSSSSSSESSNNNSNEGKKKRTKKGKKLKGKKKSKSGLEDEVIEKVRMLRERWQCSVPDKSDHCYWTAERPEHFPLRHEHFRVWAQALLKHDDDLATIEKPPNHHLFDEYTSTPSLNGSPLLQRRLQSMKNTQTSALMPIIHLHMPSGGSHANPLASASPPIQTDSGKLMLNPQLGPDLKIKDFCQMYDLSDAILDKLKDNGYQRARTFKHITRAELLEMGFKHGEIATLKDAVDDWATSM
ncbi:hypothetical protein C0992_007302 [Termitomyces sp. T32_za158]|nr:hypothetical protein C0992_007302 [Termitomyces sp. T32_za158]